MTTRERNITQLNKARQYDAIKAKLDEAREECRNLRQECQRKDAEHRVQRMVYEAKIEDLANKLRRFDPWDERGAA